VATVYLERVGEALELSVLMADGLRSTSPQVELTLHRTGLDDAVWATTLPPALNTSLSTPIVLPPARHLSEASSQAPAFLSAVVILDVDGQPHTLHADPVQVAGPALSRTTRTIGGIAVVDTPAHHDLGHIPSVDGDMEVEDDSE